MYRRQLLSLSVTRRFSCCFFCSLFFLVSHLANDCLYPLPSPLSTIFNRYAPPSPTECALILASEFFPPSKFLFPYFTLKLWASTSLPLIL
ncbi:hypothetical protein EDD18DRAFT_115078 [Armillaria luteobubalina]|uniref:Uncharacterized protein n=1 Tax=Armillaria luteobubalina TaxID=153913 RepID=A0AA39Q7G5_9AGAR|nr:hypothetical protein EDD18DRAFT_115078 [Armillaria luteobubalina]